MTVPPTEVEFCLPIHRFENCRVILTPFDFATHAAPFVKGVQDHPTLFAYVTHGPFPTLSEFQAFYETRIAPFPSEVLFAIYAKTDSSDKGGQFAGIIGFQNASAQNLKIEIGFVTILPQFHGTLITKNAVGLLLSYALDSSPEGLGLRRCQWQSHALNVPSRRLAARMKFTLEGVHRFERVMPVGKAGNGILLESSQGETSARKGPSRDSAVYAHYCYEWDEHRAYIQALMDGELVSESKTA